MTLGPVPVQTLNYLPPRGAGRPGIITTIGVSSIVVALLSGLTSFVMGLNAFTFHMVSKRPIPTAPAVMPATGPVGVVEDPVDGMDARERQMVVAVLARLHPEMSA